MDRCTVYQSQMLEYVYDLMDADAFGAVALHLEDCADCRAALRAAREQQQLLAAAARLEFSSVRFLPPDPEAPATVRPQPAAADRPVVLPLVRPRRRLAWRVWASAAAVLLVLSVPAWYSLDYLDATHDLDRHETALARLKDARQDAARQLGQLEQRQQEQAEALREKARADRVTAQLTGNGTVQAAAPNDYELEIRKGDGTGVAIKANVKLLDRNRGKELFSEQVETKADGKALVQLPRQLPVEPGTPLTLKVVRAGSDDLRPLLEENFALTPQVYLAHLATDRPVYRPGDTVRFRSLTLDRFSMEPAREKLTLHYTMRTPHGTTEVPQRDTNRLAATGLVQGVAVFEPADALRRGIGGGAWEIPANCPEGEYTLTVLEARNRFPAQQRKFLVRRDQPNGSAELAAAVAAPKKLDVEFFPEGGRLVPGGRNRVYFRVRSPQGQAAELRGRLLDDLGDEVAQLQTFGDSGQGLGFFWLTPYRGRKYELKIDSPASIEGVHRLPTDRMGEVALGVASVVTTAHEPIVARVRSAIGDRKLCVAASCRGRLFDQQCVMVRAGEEVAVRLKPGAAAGGVYRVTVFEELTGSGPRRLVPRAERLVFRQPGERLNLAIASDRDTYATGSRARLTITTRGENQQPTPAVGMVAVVDQAVLDSAEDRTTRSMPTHFYLAGEINNAESLEQADFLLSKHPAAPLALDLLLGTQGWRRFAEVRPGELKEAPMVAWATPVEPPLVFGPGDDAAVNESLQRQLHQAATGFAAERARLTATQTERDEELREARASAAYVAAQQKFDVYRDVVAALRAAFPLLGLLLLIAAAVLLGKSLGRPAARALPFFSASAACAGLLLLGVLVVFQGGPAGDSGSPQPQQTASNQGKRNEKEPPEAESVRPVMPKAVYTKATRAEEKGKKDNADSFTPDSMKPGTPTGPVGKSGAKQDGQGRSFKYDQPAKGAADGKDKAGGLPPPPPAPQLTPGATVPPPGAAPGGGVGGRPARSDEKAPHRDSGKPGDGRRAVPSPATKRDKGKELEDRAPEKDANRFQLSRQQDNVKRLVQEGADSYVREFSYNRLAEQDTALRRDFSPTVYWHPALVLPDGKVDVSFYLSDVVTTYQVTVFAHTPDGRLAAATHTFAARKPISLDPTTPAEVTAGDRLLIPLNVTNLTDKAQDVRVKMLRDKGGEQKKTPDPRTLGEGKVRVEAEGQARHLYDFRPALKQGQTSLEFQAEAKPFADSVRRDIRVVAEGFPVVDSRSDLLRGQATHEVVLPRDWVKGTLQLRLQVFPTALAEVRQGLEGLARQPDVSFNLASSGSAVPSSSTYSKETGQYGFGGFSGSYGGPGMRGGGLGPATPYSPLVGTGTAKVPSGSGGITNQQAELATYELLRGLRQPSPAAPADLEAARRFLGRGPGGLQPPLKPPQFRHSADEKSFDDLARWALTERTKGAAARELKVLEAKAKDSSDPLFFALAANGLAKSGRQAEAVTLLQKLAVSQQADGHVEPARTAGPGGRDRRVETTALAVLGWLRAGAGRFDAPAARAVRWLGQQRDARGTFGSTSATVLALKALAADEVVHKRLQEGGQVSLFAGNRLLARLPFTAQTSDALVLEAPDAEKILTSGRNVVRVEVTGKNVLPYTLAWSYRTPQPVGGAAAPLKLSAALSSPKAMEGGSVRLTVRLENTTDRPQGLTVALIGLPAGLAAPASLGRAQVSAFEVRGRELILYWRELAPRQKLEVPIDLSCRVPGEYRGPASRAYVAADAERKTWVAPLALTIVPKGK